MASSRSRNVFMLDFENACLSDWDCNKRPHPIGRNRYLDPQWRSLIRGNIEQHSDLTWMQYVQWVKDGQGDEWFQLPEEKEPDPEPEVDPRPQRPWPEEGFSFYFDRLRKEPVLVNGGLGEDLQRCRSTGCSCAQDRREAQQFADHVSGSSGLCTTTNQYSGAG